MQIPTSCCDHHPMPAGFMQKGEVMLLREKSPGKRMLLERSNGGVGVAGPGEGSIQDSGKQA